MRPHVAADLRLRARRRRHRRRRRAPGRRASRGSRRWERRLDAAAARRESARSEPRRRDLPRAARHDRALRSAGAALRRSAQRVRAGRDDHALRDVGRRAGLLPAIGQSRSAGSCCASPATTTTELDAASDAVCTALQLTNFWQDLEIDWRAGRLYVPGDDRAQSHGARDDDLDARPHDAGVARRACASAARGRARFRRGPAGLRRRRAAGCATSCARRGSAARASSTSSKRAGFDVFKRAGRRSAAWPTH